MCIGSEGNEAGRRKRLIRCGVGIFRVATMSQLRWGIRISKQAAIKPCLFNTKRARPCSLPKHLPGEYTWHRRSQCGNPLKLTVGAYCCHGAQCWHLGVNSWRVAVLCVEEANVDPYGVGAVARDRIRHEWIARRASAARQGQVSPTHQPSSSQTCVTVLAM